MAKATGKELLRRAAERMNNPKSRKARKHHAMEPGIGGPKSGNPLVGADLGGYNSAASFRGGQTQGQGGGPNVGDWPYNGRQDKRKPKARKHEARKESHKKHKSHKPAGAHGRAAVRALGRTKTTGNFKKIERTKGKAAAIGAYQNALAKHQGRRAPFGGKRAKKESSKSYAHKGHIHRSRKAMAAC